MGHGGQAAQITCGSDQNVQLLVALIESQTEPVDRVSIHQVEGHKAGMLARGGKDLIIKGFEPALGASNSDHMGTGLSIAKGNGCTDATGCASHKGDAPGQRLGGG